MKLINKLIAFALIILLAACESGYQKQLRAEEKIYKRFGSRLNKVRKAVGIPALPDKGWRRRRVYQLGPIWECSFEKNFYDSDSAIGRVRKEVFFDWKSGMPLREIDVYYSGRRFIEGDPDHVGWERLEVAFDYVSDTINGVDRVLSGSYQNELFVRGSKSAYLVSPYKGESGGDVQEWSYALYGRKINLRQADSTLQVWEAAGRNLKTEIPDLPQSVLSDYLNRGKTEPE